MSVLLDMDGLNEYVIIDIDGLTSDGWWAEDIDHAIAQYRDAYPGDTIDAVVTRGAWNAMVNGEEWT